MEIWERPKIEYTFTGADRMRAGFAEGLVRLIAPDGGYRLYWADAHGALDGWYAIAAVTVTGGRGEFRLAERVAVPAGATRLIAVADGSDIVAAEYIIPDQKRFPDPESRRLYRCGVLSDIHIDCENDGKNVYFIYAAENFARALNTAARCRADFIITAGDQITNATGSAQEWREYRRILEGSDYRGSVYAAIGNHELRSARNGGCTPADCVEEYIAATRQGGSSASEGDCRAYFTLTEPVSGDHFIFMALERGYDPSSHEEFSDEQIMWVEELLRRYSGDGHRIFLIQHSPIYGCGAGDDRHHPAYGGTLRATEEFPNHLRFKRLIERYRDIVWFSGHTHVDLRDGVNFSDEDGASCRMFHVPALAGTTRLSYDAQGRRVLDRTFYPESTQGYFLDAYADAALLCGVNFYDDKLYPAYTYII